LKKQLGGFVMRKLAVILMLAVAGAVWSLDATPAFASKMNGKCCQSSDGGRSYRARVALAWQAKPQTCSTYADSCLRVAHRRAEDGQACRAAKAQCLATGVHVGPYSGRQFAGLHRR
jgi:hypothetical protein